MTSCTLNYCRDVLPCAATNGKYFVPHTVKLLDPSVNVAPLAEKNVWFQAKTLLVPEERVEELILLFDETTEFIVVLHRLAIVDRNAKPDDELLKKYGNRTFVYSNLETRGDIVGIVPKTDRLIVHGTVTLTRKSATEFQKINAKYKQADAASGYDKYRRCDMLQRADRGG